MHPAGPRGVASTRSSRGAQTRHTPRRRRATHAPRPRRPRPDEASHACATHTQERRRDARLGALFVAARATTSRVGSLPSDLPDASHTPSRDPRANDARGCACVRSASAVAPERSAAEVIASVDEARGHARAPRSLVAHEPSTERSMPCPEPREVTSTVTEHLKLAVHEDASANAPGRTEGSREHTKLARRADATHATPTTRHARATPTTSEA
jgi:hypothetical protein